MSIWILCLFVVVKYITISVSPGMLVKYKIREVRNMRIYIYIYIYALYLFLSTKTKWVKLSVTGFPLRKS